MAFGSASIRSQRAPRGSLLRLALPLLLAWLLSACGAQAQADWKPPTLQASLTATATPQPTATHTQPPTATASATPTETLTPTPTATPTLIPSPTWSPAGPGEVTAPILLYHHIAESSTGNRYYISPETFEAQMLALKRLGYQTVTATGLAEVIRQGGRLPPRPVVITFDDGDLDVYEHAFPILQELGYVATMYVVSNYMDQPNFISSEQLKELAEAGWEIGSHSSNHYDLTLNHALFYQEMSLSKQAIYSATGVEAKTFAYPYGRVDPVVLAKTDDYGYTAGMGLGTSVTHSQYTLYYLSRREVQAAYDIETFLALLPWAEPPNEP